MDLNVCEFIRSLIIDKWNTYPDYQFDWSAEVYERELAEDDELPAIVITLTDSDVINKGFSGKYMVAWYNLDVRIYSEDTIQLHEAKELLFQIFVNNNKYPTTEDFPNPNIDFIYITDEKDDEDLFTSPTTFQKVISLKILQQKDYN